jgi:tellurite methyltransferase
MNLPDNAGIDSFDVPAVSEASLAMDLGTKWNRRYLEVDVDTARPAQVLSDNVHLLPSTGQALDLACGLGGNALFLARLGFNVTAYDISTVAVDKLNIYARHHELRLRAQSRNVKKTPPAANSFDVVVVSHFLERDITDALLNTLRPGGLLYYQTFMRERVNATTPNNPAFRLEANELLNLFTPLRVLFYREEDQVGDRSRGLRNQAMLVGQKVGNREPG